MKTTLDLPEKLLVEAKQRAAAERRPLRALVEEALRNQLARQSPAGPGLTPKWVTADGGVPEEIRDRQALYDWLERDG